MNLSLKVLHSLWCLWSLIPLLNGLGFLYIGFKTNNQNWKLEGLLYEFIWLFSVVIISIKFNTLLLGNLVNFAIIIWLISILRSIWVDYKYLNIRKLEG